MLLFRFMSEEELKAYLVGDTLVNSEEWPSGGKGFCFFNFETISPQEIYESVFGIVTIDQLALFEVLPHKRFKKTFGRYADYRIGHEKDFWEFPDIRLIEERCRTAYDSTILRLIDYVSLYRQLFLGENREKIGEWQEKLAAMGYVAPPNENGIIK